MTGGNNRIKQSAERLEGRPYIGGLPRSDKWSARRRRSFRQRLFDLELCLTVGERGQLGPAGEQGQGADRHAEREGRHRLPPNQAEGVARGAFEAGPAQVSIDFTTRTISGSLDQRNAPKTSPLYSRCRDGVSSMSFQIVALALDANDNLIERKVVPYPYQTRQEAMATAESIAAKYAGARIAILCDGWQRRARAFG